MLCIYYIVKSDLYETQKQFLQLRYLTRGALGPQYHPNQDIVAKNMSFHGTKPYSVISSVADLRQITELLPTSVF